MLQLFHQPLFRHVVVLLAIVGLLVYCMDKSRQNQRTRNTLFNCVYVLYAAAVVKMLQVIDAVLGAWLFSYAQIAGLLFVVLAIIVYWRRFPKQDDIPHNQIFRAVGWLVLFFTAVLQLAFLVLSFSQH